MCRWHLVCRLYCASKEFNDIKYETGSIVWIVRGRDLQNAYDVIAPLQVARFTQNLGTWFKIARKLLRSSQNRKWNENSNSHVVNRFSPFFFLMQFGLRQAAAFVSSAIHLFKVVVIVIVYVLRYDVWFVCKVVTLLYDIIIYTWIKQLSMWAYCIKNVACYMF